MKHKQLFHFTLLIACLLQFTLPFHAVYAAPVDKAQAEEAAIFGEKFLLCTADGFKWVSWTEMEEAEHEPVEHQDYECALCFAQSHFGKGVVAAVDHVLPISSTTQAAAINYTQSFARDTNHQHQSRAPPV